MIPGNGSWWATVRYLAALIVAVPVQAFWILRRAVQRAWHRCVLCPLGLHDERPDDPSIGWSCRWCHATGLGNGR